MCDPIMAFVVGCAAELGAEPSDAGDQRENVASSLQDHRKLRKEFWGRHLSRVLRGDDWEYTMVAEYIETQDVETRDDDFRVTE